jgi:hypothetical protein
VSSEFFKFPRTPLLISSSASPARADHVFSERERAAFLSGEIILEEKLDGANIGISISEEGVPQVQNRGAYIERQASLQFEPLWPWLAERIPDASKRLRPQYRIFGEWCFAVHSVRYDRLPDWFLGFDVYDTLSKRFWSTDKRNELLSLLRMQAVPEIARGRFDTGALLTLVRSARSAYGDVPVEGLYLRRESRGYLEGRAKIVRPDFIQPDEQHWAHRPIERNRLSQRKNR